VFVAFNDPAKSAFSKTESGTMSVPEVKCHFFKSLQTLTIIIYVLKYYTRAQLRVNVINKVVILHASRCAVFLYVDFLS